jgi:hypothetical protein
VGAAVGNAVAAALGLAGEPVLTQLPLKPDRIGEVVSPGRPAETDHTAVAAAAPGGGAGAPPHPGPAARRRPRTSALAAVAGGLLAGAAAWVAWRTRHDNE